jgi:flagellar M-ring protein FliF
VQVSVLPFDTSAADAATKALNAQASAERTAGYLSMAKQVGLALLVIIAVIIFMRRRKKRLQEEEEARIQATASDLPEGYVMPQQGLGGSQQLALAQEADLSRDRMRDEVSAMVDNQPDDVAAMLQGWLAERK